MVVHDVAPLTAWASSPEANAASYVLHAPSARHHPFLDERGSSEQRSTTPTLLNCPGGGTTPSKLQLTTVHQPGLQEVSFQSND